ncbi:MAG: cupin domain-containing protein [Anaerolineae bacterium]
MKPAIHFLNVPSDSENTYPEPFRTKMGNAEWRGLSDFFGLENFGVNLEILQPNALSSLRHWHSESDEFVFVVDGELTLVTNAGEQLLTAGMCVGFKGGEEDGHHLINKTQEQATFLVVGSRHKNDAVTYSDDDFQWLRNEEGAMKPARKNGVFYK